MSYEQHKDAPVSDFSSQICIVVVSCTGVLREIINTIILILFCYYDNFLFLAFWIPEILAVHSRVVYCIDNISLSIDCYFCPD